MARNHMLVIVSSTFNPIALLGIPIFGTVDVQGMDTKSGSLVGLFRLTASLGQIWTAS